MKIFARFGAMEHLGIDERIMANWLQLIGSKYHSKNHYHNATHAADVLQATAFFLDKMRPKVRNSARIISTPMLTDFFTANHKL